VIRLLNVVAANGRAGRKVLLIRVEVISLKIQHYLLVQVYR